MHSYQTDTLLPIIVFSSQDCSCGKSAHSWDLAFNLSGSRPPPPAGPSLSPKGNAPRSLSDFPVMELQDKLDLMIHPYGAPPGGLSLPSSPTSFSPKHHYLRPILQSGLSRENKGGGGAKEHRKWSVTLNHCSCWGTSWFVSPPRWEELGESWEVLLLLLVFSVLAKQQQPLGSKTFSLEITLVIVSTSKLSNHSKICGSDFLPWF